MKRMIAVLLMCLGAAFAQETPKLVNAKIQQVSVGAGLQQTVDSLVQQAKGAAWIGYSVPMLPRQRYICCFDSIDQWRQRGCCGGCKLEGHDGSYFNSNNSSDDC